MIIGAISDSHRETKVAASAIEWLLARGADLLVHAGDIVESETLRLLRQSGKPYFAVLGNNDEALAELKNDFNLYDEPFCTEFAGLRLKIMHHPFYLFDEEPVAQNEADGLNLGAGADRSVNLNSNFNTASADRILNGARSTDVNFKNIVSASANLKSGQPASLNVSLGANTDSDMNSNANLDLSLDAYSASSPNADLNSNASANLNTNMDSDMKSKASSSADRAVNLTVPSLNANLSAPNSCANLTALSLGSNLTANSYPNAGGESKNRGPCGCGADKISTIKIYGHTHYFAAAVDKNGALVLNPGEICGRKKRLFEFACVVAQERIAHISSPFAAQRTIKRPKGSLKMIRKAPGAARENARKMRKNSKAVRRKSKRMRGQSV